MDGWMEEWLMNEWIDGPEYGWTDAEIRSHGRERLTDTVHSIDIWISRKKEPSKSNDMRT